MTLKNDNQPWYKDRWPWILIAGPATVVVAGFITLWMAVVSDDGLVTDDYYKQGLAVNKSLQGDQRAANLGLHGDVMRSGSNLRLLLSAESDVGFPKEITLKLAHPTRAGQDQLVQMVLEGQVASWLQKSLVGGLSRLRTPLLSGVYKAIGKPIRWNRCA